MLMAQLPIAVIMQRRAVPHPWADESWAAVGIVPERQAAAAAERIKQKEAHDELLVDLFHYVVPGLQLELYPDENDGYFENWIAPAPKVFVLWQMKEARAAPVLASVSYAEGARMLDSGECADGVPMPADVHAWLGDYLRAYYRPQPRRGKEHG